MFKLNADTENNPDRTGGCWPTPQQELLLRAALLPPAEAVASWQQWCREVDIVEDELDLGSFRLLPLVYHNLRKQIPNDPLMGKLRGIHHRTWVQTQMHIQACEQAVSSLQQLGIDTMILKGVPLAQDYYPSNGTRPMGDFDLLVPKAQARAAIDHLAALGWQPIDRPLAALDDRYLDVRHAQGFSNDKGRQLDLHWHVLPYALDETIDRHFWQASMPASLGSAPTRFPSAADLFLHVCVHGAGWAPVPPVRWVADAVLILKKAGDAFDWDRLVSMAQICEVSLALHTALAYLQKTIYPEIPPHVLTEIERIPVSDAQRHLFAVQTHRSTLLGLLPILWRRYHLHLARKGTTGLLERWLGFPSYIAVCYNKGSVAGVFWWAISKTGKRIKLFAAERFERRQDAANRAKS